MKLSKQQLAAIFDDAADFDGSNEEAFDARKALLAGTLEIEGYERSQWTRFDPNDPKTHPKEGTPVLLVTYNEHDKWGLQAGHASKKFVNCWATISRMFEFKVFWREVTFPPPPTEQEETNEIR